MSTLLRRRSSSDHSRPAQNRFRAERPSRAAGPVLVEYRVITGEPAHLKVLARALRERIEDHMGHLGEVHFRHEEDRIRWVHLWHDATDLRSFVERTHTDLLAYRRESGTFPTVERTLWWSTAGTETTLEEAADRAVHLREHGPRPHAFTLASPVPA